MIETLLPVQREQVFVPVLKRPHDGHQLDLKFVLCKMKVRPVCNCGWDGTAYDPKDHASKFPRALTQYRDHLGG